MYSYPIRPGQNSFCPLQRHWIRCRCTFQHLLLWHASNAGSAHLGWIKPVLIKQTFCIWRIAYFCFGSHFSIYILLWGLNSTPTETSLKCKLKWCNKENNNWEITTCKFGTVFSGKQGRISIVALTLMVQIAVNSYRTEASRFSTLLCYSNAQRFSSPFHLYNRTPQTLKWVEDLTKATCKRKWHIWLELKSEHNLSN